MTTPAGGQGLTALTKVRAHGPGSPRDNIADVQPLLRGHVWPGPAEPGAGADQHRQRVSVVTDSSAGAVVTVNCGMVSRLAASGVILPEPTCTPLRTNCQA